MAKQLKKGYVFLETGERRHPQRGEQFIYDGLPGVIQHYPSTVRKMFWDHPERYAIVEHVSQFSF